MRRFVAALGMVLLVTGLAGCAGKAQPASNTYKMKIQVPAQSLPFMHLYLGKEKGFFAAEGIDLEILPMAPPTAVAALESGELDFTATMGAGITAIMQGHPLKRVIYLMQDPTFALITSAEVKSVEDLKGKVIAVTAPNDAQGMSAKAILLANGVNPDQVTFISTQTTENALASFTGKNVQGVMMPPPYAEELQSKGFNRLADARDHAPLSMSGLTASTAYLKKNPDKVNSALRALLKTTRYLQDPHNRSEIIDFIVTFYKVDKVLAEQGFDWMLKTYSKEGTKPPEAVQKEIDLYRETLKITKSFTPADIEDMSFLKQAQGSLDN